MEKKTKNESTDLREKTHGHVDKVFDNAHAISERGKSSMAYVKDEALRFKGNVDNYIQQNPEKSALISLGVGVVLGAVITSLIKSKRH